MTLDQLLSSPEALIRQRPYLRASLPGSTSIPSPKSQNHLSSTTAKLPSVKGRVVSEVELMAELDPYSHKVLFDDNIPSITVKHNDGSSMVEIEYARMALPIQRNILDKQVLHLCSNPMAFSLLNAKPSKRQQELFIRFKQGWTDRNLEGLKTEFVRLAKSLGRAGLLFYFDSKGRIKARTLSYADGYQICSHVDDNGEHILETVYYEKDGIQYIDSYSDTHLYRYTSDSTPGAGGWHAHEPISHGFDEIPLVTKHTRVAWDRVQSLIEVVEVNANIFSVCQKRLGWGILYVKGQFNPEARRIAGAQILNDTSGDANSDAKFLSQNSAESMIQYLEYMLGLIQLGSGTTFLLPKDIKISGDTSGVAIQLTQELDMETARNGIAEWQNCASKMARLFSQGYAKELTKSGDPDMETAITDFRTLKISAKFQLWRPQSDTEYNNLLATIHGAGGISTRTFVEKNTLSTPDEMARIQSETPDTEVITDNNTNPTE